MSEKSSLGYSPETAIAYNAFEGKQPKADAQLRQALEGININGQTVLDYGAGFGYLIPTLRELGASKILAIDPSSAMIQRAEQRLAEGKFGEPSGIELRVVKDLPLPYPSESIDGATLRFVLHYVKDTGPVFEELARVIRPGGWLVAISSDVRVKKGSEHLLNTPLPLRFLDGLTIETIVKSGVEVLENVGRAGFTVGRYETRHDEAVSIDPTYSHIGEIESFETGFLVARKSGK